MKKLTLFLVVLLINLSANAQVLLPTNLILNSGGVIHDVAYDSYYDAYIVVGNFTTINGQPRNNLAFIDAGSDSLMPQAPISNINGAIRSVEVVNFVLHTHPSLGNGHRNYIYLGGNFTSINSQTKINIARLWTTHYYSQFPNGGQANYSNNAAWNAELYWDGTLGAEYGIHDFHLMGDTLIAVGEFANVGASYITGDYNRKVIALDADNGTFLTKNLTFLNGTVPFPFNGDQPLHGVRQLNNRLFLYGKADGLELINEYTLSGTFVQQIEDCSPNNRTVLDFEPHPSSVDTMLFAYEGFNAFSSPHYITSYLNNGAVWNCPYASSTNMILNFASMVQVNYLETYKDFIINSNNNGLFVTKRNGTANVPILNSFTLNSGWYNLSYPSNISAPCLKRVNNLLFLSSNNLTNVNGSARSGLAVFCLEPQAAKPFIQSDPTACEGDSSTYTIPQAQCAGGYRWTYTGTGAFYRITASGNAWAALSTNTLLDTDANSIDVLFPSGSTGGTLTVEPFTVFSAAENHFSQGQSITITVNLVPDIILDPLYTLNCYSDTVLMVVQSSMPNVTYNWVYNNGGNTSTNDTIIITDNNSNGYATPYIVTVTNPSTGCVDWDTTYYTTDLDPPLINQSAITTNPLVYDCLTDSMSINSNIFGATVTWTSPSQTGTFADPYWIYDTTIPSGDLTVYATYLSNGCTAQADWGAITVDMVQAVGTLNGYTYSGGGTAIDTLSCANPSITVQCTVTAPFSANSNAQWLDINNVPTGSDMITLTQADANGASFFVRKFRTFNNDNGCTADYNVMVICDFATPFVPPLADQSFNCSEDFVLLDHNLNGSITVIEGWLDEMGVQTNQSSVLADSTGQYYYEVFNTLNGCSNTDTVVVTQTQEMYLDMVSDTLICPDQIVEIEVTAIGNTETPSYLWSTGSISPTQTATGGIDSIVYVTVTTPSGCIGTDSTTVSITDPVEAEITSFIGCTDGSIEITEVTQGAGNYQYSLDGSPWQTSTNFSGLDFGTYSIQIMDDLSCVYDFSQLLDGTAQSVDMDFVASTYNVQGDTIVLVNITDFTGLDSIGWGVPQNANVYFQNDSMMILSILVSGWYDVDLYGYLDSTCVFTTTNSVYFGTEAPFYEETYASKGIQSFTLSPNPTSGEFDVDVTFGTAQNYSIVVTTVLGQPIAGMSVSGTGTVVNHTLNFPFGTTGLFNVHVIADYDADQQTIMVN